MEEVKEKPLLVGIETVAEMLGVSERTVQREVRDGNPEFPRPRRVRRRVLWELEAVRRYAKGDGDRAA